jgi:hypothetical protein
MNSNEELPMDVKVLVAAKDFRKGFIKDVCAYLRADPPPGDSVMIRFADGAYERVSVSFLHQLSPVLSMIFSVRDGWTPRSSMSLLTKAEFVLLKEALTCMVEKDGVPELLSIPLPHVFRLLVVMDAYQVRSDFATVLMKHVQSHLTVADCAAICNDASITAMPDHLLQLILPTLLEHPSTVHVARGGYLEWVLSLREIKKHEDRKGLIWLNRDLSVGAMVRWQIVCGEGKTFAALPYDEATAMLPGARQCVVEEVLEFDDRGHVMCLLNWNLHNLYNELLLVCVNVHTGETVGRPRQVSFPRNFREARCVAVNAGHLFLYSYREFSVEVFDRTLGFFGGDPARQVLEAGQRVGTPNLWTFSQNTDTVLVDCRARERLAVYTYDTRDGVYYETYQIPREPFLNVCGGLWLSPARVLLCGKIGERVSLWRFERKDGKDKRGKVVATRCEQVGESILLDTRAGEGRSYHSLSHHFGRLYIFRHANTQDQEHGIWVFDAATMTRVDVIHGGEEHLRRELKVYGSRILMLQSTNFVGGPSYTSVHLFDPLTNQVLPGKMTLSLPSIKTLVPLGGGEVVVVFVNGGLGVLSRVD